MNRITIEPGPLPHQWAHIWLKDFTVVRTEYHPTLYLSESDVQWLRVTYVWVNPPAAIVPCTVRTVSPAQVRDIIASQYLPSFYSEEEKKQFSTEQKAKRDAVHTHGENQ